MIELLLKVVDTVKSDNDPTEVFTEAYRSNAETFMSYLKTIKLTNPELSASIAKAIFDYAYSTQCPLSEVEQLLLQVSLSMQDIGPSIDVSTNIEKVERATELGSISALSMHAFLLLMGDQRVNSVHDFVSLAQKGLDNIEAAIQLLDRGIEQGCPQAMVSRAGLYLLPREGVDHDKAIKLLDRAIELGSREAMLTKAVLFTSPILDKPDFNAALRLLDSSFEQGMVGSALVRINLHKHGVGTMDHPQIAYFYRVLQDHKKLKKREAIHPAYKFYKLILEDDFSNAAALVPEYIQLIEPCLKEAYPHLEEEDKQFLFKMILPMLDAALKQSREHLGTTLLVLKQLHTLEQVASHPDIELKQKKLDCLRTIDSPWLTLEQAITLLDAWSDEFISGQVEDFAQIAHSPISSLVARIHSFEAATDEAQVSNATLRIVANFYCSNLLEGDYQIAIGKTVDFNLVNVLASLSASNHSQSMVKQLIGEENLLRIDRSQQSSEPNLHGLFTPTTTRTPETRVERIEAAPTQG